MMKNNVLLTPRSAFLGLAYQASKAAELVAQRHIQACTLLADEALPCLYDVLDAKLAILPQIDPSFIVADFIGCPVGLTARCDGGHASTAAG